MNWYPSAIMLMELFLVSISFQLSLGFDLFEGEHPQAVLPLGHSGSSGYLSLLEEAPSSSVLSYLRPGRRMLKLPQTLIPYPRTGRMTDEDYDLAFLPDYSWSSSESDISGLSSPILSQHIIRKKRSVSHDASESHDDDSTEKRNDLVRTLMSKIGTFEPDFYFRQSRGPSTRSRNAFVPRIGKRISDSELDDIEDKRAAKFTPRIGRASLLPRIGRNDPRFKVKSRGAFIPRIGRRAMIPRIGRSQEHRSESDGN